MTERCVCRDLTRQDVFDRCDWGPYDDPLLGFYCLAPMAEADKERTFTRWQMMRRLWYAFDSREDGRLIAVLSLRDINRLLRNARLGIVVDPGMVNQGLGTEIMRGYIDYYFGEMRFRKLLLDVARFNLRAARCYTKCGFVKIGEFWRDYPGDYAVMETAAFAEHADGFEFKRNRLFAVYDDMKLTKQAWKERQGRALA